MSIIVEYYGHEMIKTIPRYCSLMNQEGHVEIWIHYIVLFIDGYTQGFPIIRSMSHFP